MKRRAVTPDDIRDFLKDNPPQAEPEKETPPKQKQYTNGFHLEAFIAAHLKTRSGQPIPDGSGGIKWQLEVCPFNPDHTNNSAAVFKRDNGAIQFACRHDSCTGKDWQAIRTLFERPRNTSANGNESVPPNPPQPEAVFDVRSIRPVVEYARTEIEYVVDGLLVAGSLSALTGDSGQGKTSLITAMCYAISRGEEFAGRKTQAAGLVSRW